MNTPVTHPIAAPDPAAAGPVEAGLADALMMQRYFSETLEVQQAEPALRAEIDARRLAEGLHRAVQAQGAQLAGALVGRPGAARLIEGASAQLSGMFVGFICKCRTHDARAMLRSDYALLNALTLSYRLLLQAAREADDDGAMLLAVTHLRTLHDYVGRIEHFLCPRAPAARIAWSEGASVA